GAIVLSRLCGSQRKSALAAKLRGGQTPRPPVLHLINAASPREGLAASPPLIPLAQTRFPAKCTAATHRLPDESAVLERPGTPTGERSAARFRGNIRGLENRLAAGACG